MNKLFYFRLARNNIRSNARFYLPYMLTSTLTVAVFYIICMLSFDQGIDAMPGAEVLRVILRLGTTVVGIFAVIFLLYTNSFLMKRRKKELGLFNILGMEKRHIGRVLLDEALMTCFCSLVIGLALGVLLSKLIYLLLLRIVRFEVSLHISVSWVAMAITLVLFLAVFLLALLKNMVHIKLSNPIELLHGGEAGEREPKTKWLLALLGIAFLAAGYYISITVQSPLDALVQFFIAVLLVIFGTYLLFTAVSIAVLKLLRANKRYYYKTKHFTSVSGMLYRMKQNAVGLANICILSTMVLVTVSTTVALFVGADDALNTRYPSDITASYRNLSEEERVQKVEQVRQLAAREGRRIESLETQYNLAFVIQTDGTHYYPEEAAGTYTSNSITMLVAETADEYTRRTGEPVELAADEILLADNSGAYSAVVTLGDKTYRVAGAAKKPLYEYGETSAYVARIICVVVRDDAELQSLYEQQAAVYGPNASHIDFNILLDVDGTDEEKIALAKVISTEAAQAFTETRTDADGQERTETTYVSNVQCRQAEGQDFYSLYGGFFFLGMLLGSLFLMATVLIIYYKQVSEGYDDVRRYEIMQKVGMTHREVKSSITSQLLTVFFLPLITAALHIAAAFPMITKLLGLFNLSNIELFGICTLATLGVFALIYILVYALTARSYYRIVSGHTA